MPCRAKELGVVEPFVAIENSKANTGSASCESMARDCLWRVRARHAVPLTEETATAKSGVASEARIGGSRWVFTLARASLL